MKYECALAIGNKAQDLKLLIFILLLPYANKNPYNITTPIQKNFIHFSRFQGTYKNSIQEL